MNNSLSFDTTKLNEVWEEINAYYSEYKDLTTSLELEIKKLETTWGTKEGSLYTTFKEKYEEKKSKLIELENIMKELLDTLESKKREIEEATILASNSFE